MGDKPSPNGGVRVARSGSEPVKITVVGLNYPYEPANQRVREWASKRHTVQAAPPNTRPSRRPVRRSTDRASAVFQRTRPSRRYRPLCVVCTSAGNVEWVLSVGGRAHFAPARYRRSLRDRVLNRSFDRAPRHSECKHTFVSTEGLGILHADLDSFYASVEQRDQPALRGRPILVGTGIVLAASYEAKGRGVKTPMNTRAALARCPDAVVVAPRFQAYVEASKAVFDVFNDTSPLVEGLSIDEAFIDVAGLRRIAGPADVIGHRLRERVRNEVGLAITVGVARTKFLAKVASAQAKPDGLLVVPVDGETEFLYPLPVNALWGVGPVTTERLNRRGIYTVADLARIDQHTLEAIVGKASGRHLYSLAHHQDHRQVVVGRRRKSIGSQHALAGGTRDLDELRALLLTHSSRVMRRLRESERLCSTVTVAVRFGDFTSVTRARTLLQATDVTGPVAEAAVSLLADLAPSITARGCTLIGVSVSKLIDDQGVQLSMALTPADELVETRPKQEPAKSQSRNAALDATIDELRRKFGDVAPKAASLIGRDEGFEAPKLPDP